MTSLKISSSELDETGLGTWTIVARISTKNRGEDKKNIGRKVILEIDAAELADGDHEQDALQLMERIRGARRSDELPFANPNDLKNLAGDVLEWANTNAKTIDNIGGLWDQHFGLTDDGTRTVPGPAGDDFTHVDYQHLREFALTIGAIPDTYPTADQLHPFGDQDVTSHGEHKPVENED